MAIIYNRESEVQFRRTLRKQSTFGEKLLWIYIRKRQILGKSLRSRLRGFLREYSVGRFVLDYYCPELKLAIEIDGPTHFESEAAINYDKRRQKEIESLGIKFLRFRDDDVSDNMEEVLNIITMTVAQLA